MISAIQRAIVVAALLGPAGHAFADISVTVGPERRFHYEGRPVPVRVVVRNDGDSRIENPIRSVLGSLEILDADDDELTSSGPWNPAAPDAPRRLAAGESHEVTLDLALRFPGLQRSGRYRVRWSAGESSSAWSELQVLEPYDARERYVARIRTEAGPIEIELLQAGAPIAVKAFVDLARAGYYDGQPIGSVLEHGYLAIEPEDPGIRFPAELAPIPVVAGAVVLEPGSPAPPMNRPAFMILLEARPEWTGQVTVIGRVIDGLDAASLLSRMPTAGPRGPLGGGRPARELRVDSIEILGQPR